MFLVRNHLMMSQVAQKGDLDDHTTVEEFARTVGSIDRLKALYLLTYADMRAVAPKVYNNWRDMLLSDLYLRALKVLEQGDREAVDPARRLATVKAAVTRESARGRSRARGRRHRSFSTRCPIATSSRCPKKTSRCTSS